jgi:hypothetical protein
MFILMPVCPSKITRIDRRDEIELASDLSMFGSNLKGADAYHQKL